MVSPAAKGNNGLDYLLQVHTVNLRDDYPDETVVPLYSRVILIFLLVIMVLLLHVLQDNLFRQLDAPVGHPRKAGQPAVDRVL